MRPWICQMKKGPLEGDGPEPRGRCVTSPNLHVGLSNDLVLLTSRFDWPVRAPRLWGMTSLRPINLALSRGIAQIAVLEVRYS